MTDYVNLFGEPVDEAALRASARTRKTPRGYYAAPGTGPAGKTCASCVSCSRQGHGHSRRWAKCLKARTRWTHGRRTDILVRSAACIGWEAAP